MKKLYVLQDANWNVVALTDIDGMVLERYTYDGFGKRNTLMNSGIDFDRAFTGQVLDAETRLMLYRNRYYSTSLGRFLTRDPIGYDAGDPNLYRYVKNSTMFFQDPSGLNGAMYIAMSRNIERPDTWTEWGFIMHYWTGFGKTVNYHDVGVHDIYVKSIRQEKTDNQKSLIKELVSDLPTTCDSENETSTHKGWSDFVGYSKKYGPKGEFISNPGTYSLYTVFGRSYVEVKYSCTISLSCCCQNGKMVPKTAKFTCKLDYEMSDDFENPKDVVSPDYARRKTPYESCIRNCKSHFHWLLDRPHYLECVNSCKNRYPNSEYFGATPYNMETDWQETVTSEVSIGKCD